MSRKHQRTVANAPIMTIAEKTIDVIGIVVAANTSITILMIITILICSFRHCCFSFSAPSLGIFEGNVCLSAPRHNRTATQSISPISKNSNAPVFGPRILNLISGNRSKKKQETRKTGCAETGGVHRRL